jgi:hypothetical protein
VGFQIGQRWLREKNYVEDGLVDVATRMEDEVDGHNDADEGIGDIEKRMPQNRNADTRSAEYGNLMVSPEIQQRSVNVKAVSTRNMGPVERHNHLVREGKCLAEVASRTPVNTHVASIIVLATLTKGMLGHDMVGLKTAMEALTLELPSMVGQELKKSVKGSVYSYDHLVQIVSA